MVGGGNSLRESVPNPPGEQELTYWVRGSICPTALVDAVPSSWPSAARTTVYSLVVAGVIAGLWFLPTDDGPGRSDNRTDRGGDDDRTLYVVYPAHSSETTAYRARAEEWASFWDRRFDARVRADTAVTPDSLRGTLSLVAGTPASPLVSAILTELGVTIPDDGAFVVGGRAYDDSSEVLLLQRAYPNKDRSHSNGGVHLVVGQSASAGLPYAYASFFLQSGLSAEYQILRDGRLHAYGRLTEQPARTAGACRLSPLPIRHVHQSPDQRPSIKTDYVRVFNHGSLDSSVLEAFAAQRTSLLRSAHASVAPTRELDTIDYHLFRRPAGVQHFRARVSPVEGNIRSWLRSNWQRDRGATHSGIRIDSSSSAIALAVDARPPSVSPAEARHWMRTFTGSSVQGGLRSLLAMGQVATETSAWRDVPLETQASRLHDADLIPSLRALASDTTFVHASRYAQAPVAAVLDNYLAGKDAVEQIPGETLSIEDLRRLNTGWQMYLDSLATTQRIDSHAPVPVPDDFYGANVAFATGPSSSSQGYASRRAEASFGALRDLGATAASIVPYAAMPDPHAPADLLHRRHHRGTESDATIERAIETAHDLGLRVLLKPQIAGEVDWPGDIEMSSEEEWDAFFGEYADWILHYALMAQRHDVEMLAIGTELTEATRNHETEWRGLIKRVRAVYDGTVTYAANWDDEAGRLTFADALDVVGVDAYYPLSADAKASDAALRAGAEEVASRLRDIAERTDRPVLLTEMGFPNTQGAWAHPHEKREDKPERPEDQARATRALTDALSDTSIQGALWWRWPPVCRFDYGRFEPAEPTRAALGEWLEKVTRSDAAVPPS